MTIDVQSSLNFGNARRILNLPDAVADQEPVTLSQLKAGIEGLAQKDNVRVATQANISLSSPGATVDGITMTSGDRVLVKAQTTQTENGIYIWNGAAVLMTRAVDGSTFDELESALVPVDEGTNAGTVWRQTAVNGVIGTNNVLFSQFGTSSAPATTSSLGSVQLATQGEVDTGTDAAKGITPATLAGSVYASKKYGVLIGDGSATSYTVTHNLNSRDVIVEIYRNSGNYDTVLVETQRTSVNAVTLVFDVAPTSNAYRVLVRN